jgi:hypothetical protein
MRRSTAFLCFASSVERYRLEAQAKHDVHERLAVKGCSGLVARNLAEQLRIL